MTTPMPSGEGHNVEISHYLRLAWAVRDFAEFDEAARKKGKLGVEPYPREFMEKIQNRLIDIIAPRGSEDIDAISAIRDMNADELRKIALLTLNEAGKKEDWAETLLKGAMAPTAHEDEVKASAPSMAEPKKRVDHRKEYMQGRDRDYDKYSPDVVPTSEDRKAVSPYPDDKGKTGPQFSPEFRLRQCEASSGDRQIFHYIKAAKLVEAGAKLPEKLPTAPPGLPDRFAPYYAPKTQNPPSLDPITNAPDLPIRPVGPTGDKIQNLEFSREWREGSWKDSMKSITRRLKEIDKKYLGFGRAVENVHKTPSISAQAKQAWNAQKTNPENPHGKNIGR